MLPIGDDNIKGQGAAFVTLSFIALNVMAFFLEINQPSEQHVQAFVTAWGVVPLEYTRGADLPPLIDLPVWSTLFTSMFLHGGWAHLFGNMLFLWVFGDNVEHRIGHGRFLIFYLATGVAAALAHILFNAESIVPTVGASGAISGVLGGYLVMFPRNRVYVLTWGGVIAVPAVFMLGLWILLQFVNQAGAVADTPESGGVAYLAHIGGFVAGMILAPLLGLGAGETRKARR
ncbi:MAG: rhomboid family intramembrane serine protease [Acidobacteriota bacterium]|nr:rhomboid family intramembrane serine protease [Acidobacteriota bacterium]